ncbi:cytochrome c3 family protein [Desulfurivibrio alkaliphilus]|uniref:Doubled CXXCH motif domain-containing protein n=1 Tax=Desulfurivibrio alkaliphilus (strain DSM 19089 / UNIQEM U267 / AHT2) TaxID=589865 RepID=D6Z1P0_DESAT|nr:cytochrome c3 family protein [Desulfurivibrio alkaliphilus]ADH85465.1 hypothetical protein DaAHT2_0761 [Desulfurivibrio alkaliphilus AHT 2]
MKKQIRINKQLWKPLLAAAVIVGSGYLLADQATAQVSGECVNCHTMHGSFEGESMAYDESEAVYPALTRGDCLGCHSSDGTPLNPDNYAPAIYHAGEPMGETAAGSFYWVTQDDRKGHNVVGVVDADQDISTAPGGMMMGQVTCATATGCHGDPQTLPDAGNFASISGQHHAERYDENNRVKTGESMRMLRGEVDGYRGMMWEAVPQVENRNVYYAVHRESAGDSTERTISNMCATCHGDFHSGDKITENGMSSPWLRHPTDLDMAQLGGEYENYEFTFEAPVGSSQMDSYAVAKDTSQSAVVTCLSCHRAHASEYDSMLRFDYSGIKAHEGAEATGCTHCHTSKS